MHSKGYRCKLSIFKDHLTMRLVLLLRRGFIHTTLENEGENDAQGPNISSFCKVKKWRYKYIIQSNLMRRLWSNQGRGRGHVPCWLL